MNGLPPGLRGYVAAEQMANQRGMNGLAQLQGLMGLQAAMEQQEINKVLKPLQVQQLQIAVQQAQQNAALRKQLQGGGPAPQSFGEGGMSLPGGGQGNFNTGQVVPPQQGGGGFGGVPPQVANMLLSGDGGLKALGTAMLDQTKPTDRQRDAVALGYRPGTPEYASFVGTQFNQGGAWQMQPGGGVRLAPGYAEGQGSVEDAQQRSRARYDLVTVPSTGPGSPPTFRSRLDVLGGSQAPIPSPMNVPPDVQSARDIEAARIRAREGQPNGGGAVPTSRVVNAAGMSPEDTAAQAASEAAATATATGRAKAGVDYETGILESGHKAKSSLTQLQILAPSLERLPTGPLYPAMVNAGGYLQQFGIDVGQLGKDLGPAQASQAVLNQLALKLRDPSGGGGMPGAMSDADRQFLVNAIPGLNKIPDGNRVLIDIMMRLEQRKVDEASIVTRMQAAGKTSNEIREALSQFGSSRPLAPDLQRRLK